MTVKRKKKKSPKPDRNEKFGKSGPLVWKDEYYVKAFKLAKAGLNEDGIAAGLGVSSITYHKWKRRLPALREAIKEGRKKDDKDSTTYAEYVYNRLEPSLQQLWSEIMRCCEVEEPNAIARLESALSECGRRGRQMLFLHALIHFNFDLSQALRAVNISRDRFDRWLVGDPEFARLIDQMDWHRKNFFEAKLFELVAQGDPGIVKFVNQTKNADRGYGKTTTINKNVNVSGEVRQVSIPIDSLDLDPDKKREMLKTLRAQKKRMN